jgi:hypothetical protein
MQEKERVREELRIIKEQEELEGATFRPELIASAPGEEEYYPSVRDRGGIKTEDFLIFYGKVAQERRLKLQ